MHHCFIYEYAAAFLMIAGPASAGYVIEPLPVQGTFTPVTITDDRYVAGTIVNSKGTLALITNGTDSHTYDFCGTRGASDNTVLNATSPYSVDRYLAGDCGYSSEFLYDVARNVLTAMPLLSPTGTTVSAVGSGGLVAGVTDPHSGGDNPFYYRNGHYVSFYPGQFSTITQITGNGTIVGYWRNVGGVGAGFVFKPDGTLVNAPPPQTSFNNYLLLNGGNRHDQLAATVLSPDTGIRAALWQSSQYTYPPLPAGTVWSFAYAINEKGDIAGTFSDATGATHVFVWHSSTDKIEVVSAPPGAQAMSVSSINNHGDITGTYTLSGSTQAYRALCRPWMPR